MSDVLRPSGRRFPYDTAARCGGLLAGAVLAWSLAERDTGLGTGVLYGLAAFSGCAVAGVLVGDALRPRPRGAVRSAGLGARRVRDWLPLPLVRLLGVLALLLTGLLAGAWATGSADDMSRAGRALTAVCGNLTESHGPWPGSWYAAPMLGLLAVGTGLCGWALRRITLAASDDPGRRARGRAVAAAWGLLVTVPLTGVALTMSGALLGTVCLGTGWHVLGWALLPVTALAGITAVGCLTMLLAPRLWADGAAG